MSTPIEPATAPAIEESLSRAGFWTGMVFAGLGVPYAIGVAAAFAGGGFPPAEPVSTLLHVLMLISPLILVLFLSIIHTATPRPKSFLTLASLMCVVMLALSVVVNRFVALTTVRYATVNGHTEDLNWFLPYEWPSIMMALEVLGWGLFFGLACLCLVPVFSTTRLDRAIQVALVLSAAACLFGVVALAMNNFELMAVVAPIGWGPGAAVSCVLIAIRLRQRRGLG